MRILGASNDEDYIVQLTKGELTNILGFYSKYDKDLNDILKKAKNGIEIPVSKVYLNYHNIKGIVNSSEYSKARNKLNEMLNALEPIELLLTKLKEEYEANKA